MKVRTIKRALGASVLAGEDQLDNNIENIYASDLMSDVLAFGMPNSILLTGLATRQAIISAHMAEFNGVVLIRGKQPKDGAEVFARDQGLILLSTDLDMYDACVRIEMARNQPSSSIKTDFTSPKKDEILLSHEFNIKGTDFANAGSVSTEVKSILKKIGIAPKLTRRVAIATYEGEMNVVMHAESATTHLILTSNIIKVIIDDKGKGIPDVDVAMQKGYTTATEEQRSMGFGSGMGLPNIDKNTDELKINSVVDKGTRLELIFFIK